jgi:hypothetical protein
LLRCCSDDDRFSIVCKVPIGLRSSEVSCDERFCEIVITEMRRSENDDSDDRESGCICFYMVGAAWIELQE